jgi:hypothetical protein
LPQEAPKAKGHGLAIIAAQVVDFINEESGHFGKWLPWYQTRRSLVEIGGGR